MTRSRFPFLSLLICAGLKDKHRFVATSLDGSLPTHQQMDIYSSLRRCRGMSHSVGLYGAGIEGVADPSEIRTTKSLMAAKTSMGPLIAQRMHRAAPDFKRR